MGSITVGEAVSPSVISYKTVHTKGLLPPEKRKINIMYQLFMEVNMEAHHPIQ